MSHVTADVGTPQGAADVLRSTVTLRIRAQALLAQAREGRSPYFEVDDPALKITAAHVADVTRSRYPSLRIPYHSRWRHFEAGGIPRAVRLDQRLGPVDAASRARAQIDLVVVSVLLDAGAGAQWHYHEPDTGLTLTRSEGLGVASFQAFTDGLFSSDPTKPLQVDAAGLQSIDASRLAQAFQVTGSNPLVGLEGRAALLQRLGQALSEQPARFGARGRPGGLFDSLPRSADGGIEAHEVLRALLIALSGIWAAQNSIANLPLGDCWRHPGAPGEGLTQGWMPFHKLSQWLTYSLLEPLQWAGLTVHGLDALTGLPEYRNGGLLLDTGVLRPKVQDYATRCWQVGDPFIVEWRALTVALLDELAPLVRHALGQTAQDMPLACVLEGGTWAAGRTLAQSLRQGLPPLSIASDGTVF